MAKMMQLLKYELTDWETYNQNFYRCDLKYNGCRIGLIIDANVKDITTDNCFWRFDVYIPIDPVNLSKKIYELYYSMYGNEIKPRYHYNDLEFAKNNIDKFITRINKLKAFI